MKTFTKRNNNSDENGNVEISSGETDGKNI
jgi:hypothetical protein